MLAFLLAGLLSFAPDCTVPQNSRTSEANADGIGREIKISYSWIPRYFTTHEPKEIRISVKNYSDEPIHNLKGSVRLSRYNSRLRPSVLDDPIFTSFTIPYVAPNTNGAIGSTTHFEHMLTIDKNIRYEGKHNIGIHFAQQPDNWICFRDRSYSFEKTIRLRRGTPSTSRENGRQGTPDIRIARAERVPSTVRAGGSARVTLIVENQGLRNWEETDTAIYVTRTRPSFTPGLGLFVESPDFITLLRRGKLTANMVGSIGFEFQLDPDTPPGTYWVSILLDESNAAGQDPIDKSDDFFSFRVRVP